MCFWDVRKPQASYLMQSLPKHEATMHSTVHLVSDRTKLNMTFSDTDIVMGTHDELKLSDDLEADDFSIRDKLNEVLDNTRRVKRTNDISQTQEAELVVSSAGEDIIMSDASNAPKVTALQRKVEVDWEEAK